MVGVVFRELGERHEEAPLPWEGPGLERHLVGEVQLEEDLLKMLRPEARLDPKPVSTQQFTVVKATSTGT